MEQSWLAANEEQKNLFDYFNWTGVPDIPEEILNSLARWVLLYDVPFPYMAVREEMLPPESIRFFLSGQELYCRPFGWRHESWTQLYNRLSA